MANSRSLLLLITSLFFKSGFTVNPDDYLERYGYLENIPGHQHSPAARRGAIKEFQSFAQLPVTGRLDPSTLHAMEAPRCGLADKEKLLGEFRSVTAWSKRYLTWRLENYTPDMSVDAQREAITRGMNYWTEVVDVYFKEVGRNEPADIKMSFGRGQHGKCDAFSGPGGVLAHAFYPEDGRLHFDDDEHWTEGTHDGINLRLVTTHEMGHILGLSHSDDDGAIMAPIYAGYHPHEGWGIPDDDRQGAEQLYGPKKTGGATTRDAMIPTPTLPTYTFNPCTDSFDTIFTANDDITYAIKGKYVAKIEPGRRPVILDKNDVFDKLPPVGASFYGSLNGWHGLYIMTGTSMYRYHYDVRSKTFQLSPGFPKDKRNIYRYPHSPKAAFVDIRTWVIIIEGDHFVYYQDGETELREEKVKGYFHVPSDIEAAVTKDSIYYFFRGNEYYTYNEADGTYKSKGPFRKDKRWMGC